jgi:hypothetical protein
LAFEDADGRYGKSFHTPMNRPPQLEYALLGFMLGVLLAAAVALLFDYEDGHVIIDRDILPAETTSH